MASTASTSLESQPLSAPPPGVIPNFTHPESIASEIYVAAGVCMPLVLLFAVVRYYAKIVVMKKWAWDDLTFTLGLIAGLSYMSLSFLAASGGVFGVHVWDILLAEYSTEKLILSQLFEAIYGPLIWFVKLSLFMLYVQTFRPLKWLRYWAYAGALVTGLFYYSTTIAMLAICVPRDGINQLSLFTALNSPFCFRSTTILVIVIGVVSLISDLYLVILPLPAVWMLRLPLRRKIAVSAMFFVGSTACIASAFALAYRVRVIVHGDPFWDYVPLSVVTNVEFTAGLLVCCMPTIAIVFRHFQIPMSHFLSSSRRGRTLFSTSGASKDYEMDSVANLKPVHTGGSSKTSGEETGYTQGPWSGPGETMNGITRWSPEYETHSNFETGEADIRRTTDIYITRYLQSPA
ncbi:hypothetical protein MMC18_008035 [Xylographa bjoerkii]|nr:hypothetical protein [Xylographa bjoerkii]